MKKNILIVQGQEYGVTGVTFSLQWVMSRGVTRNSIQPVAIPGNGSTGATFEVTTTGEQNAALWKMADACVLNLFQYGEYYNEHGIRARVEGPELMEVGSSLDEGCFARFNCLRLVWDDPKPLVIV